MAGKSIRLGKLLTISEAAELTGYSKFTLYEAIRLGRLEYYKPKGRTKGYRVTEEGLEAWLRGDWDLYDLQ